jgi:hypothetical protein
MAGQAQAQAFISLNLETANQIAQIKDAAKAAERELKRVDKEIDGLLAKGKVVSDDLLRRRELAKSMITQNAALMQRQTQQMLAYEDAKKTATIFRAMAGAQAIRGIITGDADPRQIAQLVASPTTARLLEKAGFLRVGGALTRALPAGALAWFAVDVIKDAFAERDKVDALERQRLKDIAAGKLPPGLLRKIEEEDYGFHPLAFMGQKSAAIAETEKNFNALVKAFLSEHMDEEAMTRLGREAIREGLGGGGAFPGINIFSIETAYAEFLREKKRREEIGFYKALTQEEQSQLAGEIIGKLNSVDADVAGKFAQKMGEVIKRNSKLKDDERRRQQAEKSPTALFEEQEQRHALRVATTTRRYDWLAMQAKERMFVRD